MVKKARMSLDLIKIKVTPEQAKIKRLLIILEESYGESSVMLMI